MLAHDRRIAVRVLLQGRAQRRFSIIRQCTAQRIAHRHRNVAQPALMADAADGAAGHALIELGLAPGEQLEQGDVIEMMTDFKIGLAGELRVFVPGANQLAVITAVNAVADSLAELFGDRSWMLDSEIGNAAPRVELVGRDDRLGGADVDALMAGAAMFAGIAVGGQGQVGIELA